MRRIVCLLLSLVLCAGLLPMTVLAASEDDPAALESLLAEEETTIEEEIATEEETTIEEEIATEEETTIEEETTTEEETAVEVGLDTEQDIGGSASAVALDGAISSYTAITIGGNTVRGSLTSSVDSCYYRFTLASSGAVTLKTTSAIEGFYITVYDVEQNSVWNAAPSASSTGEISETYTLHLTMGTYYIGIERWGKNYGAFAIATSFDSANESWEETQGGTNNSISAADSIVIRGTYKGQLALNDTKDFYKFTLASAGMVTCKVTSAIERFYISLYDADGKELESLALEASSAGEILETHTFHLTKGTYYISFACWGKNYGAYKLVTTFTDAGESFSENQGGSNNTLSAANSISLGVKYTGQIALNDEKDFYQFTTNREDTIKFLLTAEMEGVCITVFNSSGNTVFSKTQFTDSGTGLNEQLYEETLAPGTYYVSVSKYGYRDYYGNYTLRVGSENSARIVVTYASAVSGGTVTLTANMTKNPGVQAMVVTPEYDTNYLTLTSVANGTLFDSMVQGTNLVFDSADETTGTGCLCTMTFAVKSSAPDGKYTVNLIARECVDDDGKGVDLQTSGGEITVGGILYGDANGDGKVNTSDLALLRKYLANYVYATGTSSVTVYAGADANGDGKVNTSDLALLRKYLANYVYATGSSSVKLGP